MRRLLFVLFLFLGWSSRIQCQLTPKAPNVILIMADDMGYECLENYGSTAYQTPELKDLARTGIQFNNCQSQPLCTPSRVKIMTGLYNYRNYDFFGNLQEGSYTIGNLMQDAGYQTCIAGKWQLNGLAFDTLANQWGDQSRPNRFGFDQYCLWQHTQNAAKGGRFANPLIEQDGVLLPRDPEAYGPDIFVNYILDFIEKNQEQPFFVYYPMVLVHDPFVPTPESSSWENPDLRYQSDTSYFKDMVSYTDRIVGKIRDQLQKLHLLDNTILIFTGDNGTHRSIRSKTSHGTIVGGKGKTIDSGVHVPLIISWPAKTPDAQVYNGLIDFSDFFPTLADLTQQKVKSDGISFWPLLKGKKFSARKTALVHYDPQWNSNVNRFRNRFIRNLQYKLYLDGRFFDLSRDIEEQFPLRPKQLKGKAKRVYKKLHKELEQHPVWKNAPRVKQT